MLDLKIKTMDGQTHTFSVPDNTTIGNLKERTAATLSIPAGSQRVIYQGRVLANDYKLSQSHHEQTLHVVRSPAASSNNVPASQSGNRTSNQSTNATASNRPINAGGMMRINIGHANDLNSIFQDAIGRSISGSLGSVLNQGSNVPGRPTIVDINLDDIQVEMERTPTVSGSVERSQQRPATTTTSHFYPRSMNSLWTHLGDLERLLESEQVSARSQPESTGGAGGENVNSNTIPADDVPAVQVEETESNSSVEFSQTPVPLRPSQRSLNLSNTNLGPSDQNQSTSQTNTNNTTRDRNRTVMVSEFHDFMRRFTLLQPRISRWMTRATDFYARDPSFQSTTGEDYVEQEIFLQNFQQANRLIGMIHRSLANAHVPLSQIPPRALMAQSQEAVPLVSGMSIFRTEREIPAGGAPEAARSSRRSETSNASGRRDRGRIHVRSSTPSSRSASANFNMPSNSFTILGTRSIIVPSRLSSIQRRSSNRENPETATASTASSSAATTTTTQASGRSADEFVSDLMSSARSLNSQGHIRDRTLTRILQDVARMRRESASNPRPAARSRSGIRQELRSLLDIPGLNRIFRTGSTRAGSSPPAPANSAEQVAGGNGATGADTTNGSVAGSSSSDGPRRSQRTKRSASSDDLGGKSKKSKK